MSMVDKLNLSEIISELDLPNINLKLQLKGSEKVLDLVVDVPCIVISNLMTTGDLSMEYDKYDVFDWYTTELNQFINLWSLDADTMLDIPNDEYSELIVEILHKGGLLTFPVSNVISLEVENYVDIIFSINRVDKEI